MATYSEQLQRVWQLYEAEHSQAPATARDVVAWGVEQGLIKPPRMNPLDKLAEDMSRALREEYRTDKKGRRYRVNHAVRFMKGGVQITFWAIMDFAPRAHMERAFAQRRKSVVDDCVQLRTDVDVYNDMNEGAPPVQVVLDFTHDVEEIIALRDDEKAA